ncbi:TaqI-like C-terminal specificity domain-containing protein [Dolichospermum circinale CS-534/05]|uniref:Eco57I restriction-modification methylase domain-containing protein n=1 Tax=Dolichospermum circinale TaxID=109265 RepID=UPI00232B9E28|nr:TaqI-like C-terminal specificity domain-containing protein [Dolichospermum circinale]MDB9489640.1 TaqI-like C-terminal specificity domain-containing protein [Dolichospermum circinale CS-534/05]
MKKQQIQNLFNQRYNQAKWKQFLGQTFANVQLLSTPENLTGIDDHVATNAQKLGYILLDENGIDRQIAVYEVTLANGIILERNRVGLRNLLRKYWQNIDAAFIVYHHPENTNWRFTYVSELTGYDPEGEFIKITTEPKRYTYILGEGESIKTAVERFERIINQGNKATLDDIKEAFSVEKLSQTFFQEYKKHYDIFCKYIISQPGIYQTIFNGNEKTIRDFNKKLLGRIVFLYFIQKKGWLGVPENENWGNGDDHFLTNQFQKFTHKELFYQDFLSVLFFDTLNTKRHQDLIQLGENQPCRIPYLNGGLFEEDNPKYRNLIFPDYLFANLFNFFDQYNFTIYEDDPNDHTIAVDPEMLGHIFENLLEDNKDKGAYYTPKEIVHYMCQESLIEYLTTWFENHGYEVITDASLAKFDSSKQINRTLIEKLLKNKLDDDDQKLIKNYAAEFNQALDKVKICDPAIGSGAFPMGLLHEIFTAKQTLHTFEFGNTTNFHGAEVKLNIIQNSIYGVDIERGAVDIARLRFWLSLIVDEKQPKALPNLDYKIVVGNSLVSKLGDDIIDIDWEMKDVKQGSLLVDVFQPEEILRKISEKQKQFFSPDSDKKKLAVDIRNLKVDLLISQLELMIKSKGMETKPTGRGKALTKQTEIYLQTVGWKQNIQELKHLKDHPDLFLNFFDWKLDFPEVMNQQVVENVGFDIVIANPPYGAKLLVEEKKYFTEIYKHQDYQLDTYLLFMERSFEVMKANAVNALIIPNTWLINLKLQKIRRFIVEENTVLNVIHYHKSVFENAVVDTQVVIFKKQKNNHHLVNILEYKDIKNPITTNINQEKWKQLFGEPINIFIDQKTQQIIDLLQRDSNLLSEICDVINGMKPYEIGKGNPNQTKEIVKNRIYDAEYQVNETYRPLLRGKDINKYITLWDSKRWIKYGDNLAAPRYSANFDLPEKIVIRQTSDCLIATLDTQKFICMNNLHIVNSKNEKYNLKYILAIINSKLMNFYYETLNPEKGEVLAEVKKQNVEKLLIKIANNKTQLIFMQRVDEILTFQSQGKDTTALEQQIDNMVYKLYELTYQEVKIIDPEFALTEQEYADIKIDK